jgi:hypothetical protein
MNNKALWDAAVQPHDDTVPHGRDWSHAMSNNVAYALLTYTGLQIFVTMGALEGDGHSILPYFALVVLVAAIIPACRAFEQRWAGLDGHQDDDADIARRFGRDRLALWLMAIGLPFLLTGIFTLVAARF